ncbi:tachylectin-related carbohydrate-binding protein [Bradyrhizobium sp. AZCC 1721]|uniref:tachylectin-related carbohydrate-binding protein n=1 Tax=Bradyrhizobium sp. AZCC 1721 TaxID=3117016 RepID=UPI002FF29A16
MARTNASFGTGDLLSYADDGTPGNVNVGSPMVVGFGGWQDFKFLFSGRNVRRFEPTGLGGRMTGNALVRPALDVCDQAICENRIYAVRRPDDDLLSYGDDGTPGNVSSPVVVGVRHGWQDFWRLFSGVNLAGWPRIYGVASGGRLVSYGDDGTPGNVKHGSPVVIGPQVGAWSFDFIFSGRNVAGENRIYAVNHNGDLLTWGDNGTPGNLFAGNPWMVVGFGGWQDFKFLFSGRNVAGEDRIYAVNHNGELLSYRDNGTPGNVSSPVVVGVGGWQDFKFLFAGRNIADENRIYAVVA